MLKCFTTKIIISKKLFHLIACVEFLDKVLFIGILYTIRYSIHYLGILIQCEIIYTVINNKNNKN